MKYVCDVVVRKFTFAISSTYEFLYLIDRDCLHFSLPSAPYTHDAVNRADYSHGISVPPFVCLSVTCKIVTLAKRQ